MKNFDWREFLELAKALRGFWGPSFSAEAAKRAAVSRAYYAAFCICRNFAKQHFGFRPRKGESVHKQVRECLSQQDVGWKEIADLLRDLQRWRGQCDYDDVIKDNLDRLVTDAIRTAERILSFIRGRPCL